MITLMQHNFQLIILNIATRVGLEDIPVMVLVRLFLPEIMSSNLSSGTPFRRVECLLCISR